MVSDVRYNNEASWVWCWGMPLDTRLRKTSLKRILTYVLFSNNLLLVGTEGHLLLTIIWIVSTWVKSWRVWHGVAWLIPRCRESQITGSFPLGVLDGPPLLWMSPSPLCPLPAPQAPLNDFHFSFPTSLRSFLLPRPELTLLLSVLAT